MSPPSKENPFQTSFDFEESKWPEHHLFPLNLREPDRTVQSILYPDIESSEYFIVLTGFTSLSNLIDLFGARDHPTLKKVRILIGFEPNIRGRKAYPRTGLDKQIKEYWLKKGLSIMQGGAVMHLIGKIEQGIIEFKFRDKLHAKIYVGDNHAILGSSNFSRNGLNEQDEANIRVSRTSSASDQYTAIRKIAENYYDDSSDYNKKLIGLLQNLIKEASWQEALARAIAEMLEGGWLKEYREIAIKIEQAKLWPTQWKGLAQAITILQSQSNVLVADPTGAGKTKLCTALVLALQHWLYEIGKHHRTESLIVCPPLVVSKWGDEFKSFNKINHTQVSMGLLSNSSEHNKRKLSDQLRLANILVIDEAHSYLADSNRTNHIMDNVADHKILITATPISKKVEDLLSLIKLLDVDNLKDEDFVTYQQLVLKPYLGNRDENIRLLRKFISQFTVRRTKRSLNAEIEKDKNAYINRLDKPCRFPLQKESIYKTKETQQDKILVKQINDLSAKLKGITYMPNFKLPKYEITKDENLKTYVDRRIRSAKALSVYMIRASLRSSHVALVEHIEGSDVAMNLFGFEGKTKESGNKLKRITHFIFGKKLPYRNAKFIDDYFPEWLTNQEKYLQACQEELELYSQIADLAKKLSGKREQGKVDELVKAALHHDNILAFDSTVITLYYLRKLFREKYPQQGLLVATGSENDRESKKVLELFNLDSTNQTNYIALCSDKMSESVDLQKASCVFLLDTPSVVRTVEQRIGRADRMDSVHDQIEIYWAYDSEEYSLKTDERLIDTNDAVELIYGSNFNVPAELKGRRFANTENIHTIISEFKDFQDKDESWAGIYDKFEEIKNLKEGPDALIAQALYNEFIGVIAEVKTRVSFVSGVEDWCFIALRGDQSRSPRWYFIDSVEQIHADYADICQLLRASVSNEVKRLPWNDIALKKYVDLFKARERELLPPKKGRALNVACWLLKQKLKTKSLGSEEKKAHKDMLSLIEGRSQEVIDYERLADEWIIVLQPYLTKKREANRLKRKRGVITLNNLKSEHSSIHFNVIMLGKIAGDCIIADEIDKRIAACIIGVRSGDPDDIRK